MNIILGVGTLVIVLIIMTLFLNFAPYGKQGLQALSGAACATYLPQAFLSYAIGGVFHIKFFQEIGDLAGSLSGIAVGILTCLNLRVSPVFAVIVGLVLHDQKLLPAFIAARRNSALVIPGISDGYCIARKSPIRARSSTSNSRIFTPSNKTSPLVTS